MLFLIHNFVRSFYVVGYNKLILTTKNIVYGNQLYRTPFRSLGKIEEMSFNPVVAVRKYLKSVHCVERWSSATIERRATPCQMLSFCETSLLFSVRRSKKRSHFGISEYSSGDITTTSTEMISKSISVI